MTKLISWNVNEFRACVGKGLLGFFQAMGADVFYIQESKLQEGQIELDLPGYHRCWDYARKKGCSGTAVFTREEPISVAYGIGMEERDTEGCVTTAEFPKYYMVTCYTLNSQDGLARLDYRMKREDNFLSYLKGLEKNEPVIFCGGLDVAHEEISLKNPKTNRKNASFTDKEREEFTDSLSAEFIDILHYFYPGMEGIYSWWSYRFNAKTRNTGWRIDCSCISESLKDKLVNASIHTDIMSSDRCPMKLTVN